MTEVRGHYRKLNGRVVWVRHYKKRTPAKYSVARIRKRRVERIEDGQL